MHSDEYNVGLRERATPVYHCQGTRPVDEMMLVSNASLSADLDEESLCCSCIVQLKYFAVSFNKLMGRPE